MPKPLRETAVISEAAAADAKKSGRMLVQFINPGWGSSGYYSPEVLEAAARDNVIPAGTHMYADHPTDTEAFERPERSIRDLMAVTTQDAHLAEDGALVGEIRVLAPYRELVEDVHDAIGLSIRGDATDITEGEAEGRQGRIIEGLAHVSSVDFVTRAGRGGKVLQLLESARVNRRALGHDGVEEATVNDTREALQAALRDAHGGENTYVWIRDFDDSTVWFEVEGPEDGAGIYGQGYTSSDGAVALTGDRTEVRVVTNYVPVTRPDSTNPTTEADQEVTMGNIQIEESQHRELVEKAGRVDALEERAATAERERDELREANARRERDDRVRVIVAERAKEAGVEFTPREIKGFLADVTLTEAGELDEAALTTLVDADAASKKETGTSTGLVGFGESSPSTTTVEESTPTTTPWGRPLTVKGA